MFAFVNAPRHKISDEVFDRKTAKKPRLASSSRLPPQEITVFGDVKHLDPGDRRVHVDWILQASTLIASMDQEDDDSDIDDGAEDAVKDDDADQKMRTMVIDLGLQKEEPAWHRLFRSGIPLSVPLCSIQCTDPLLILRTLEFWNVAWSAAPRCMLDLFFYPNHPQAHAIEAQLNALAAATHYPMLDVQIRRLAYVRKMMSAPSMSTNAVNDSGNKVRIRWAAAHALCQVLSIVEIDAAFCHRDGVTHDPELLHVLLEMLVKKYSILADPVEFEDALVYALSAHKSNDGLPSFSYIDRPSQCASLVLWCRERLEGVFRRMENYEPPQPNSRLGDEPTFDGVSDDWRARRQEHPTIILCTTWKRTDKSSTDLYSTVNDMRRARQNLVLKCLLVSDMESAEKCATGSLGVPSAYADARETWGWEWSPTVQTRLCPHAMLQKMLALVPLGVVVRCPRLLETYLRHSFAEPPPQGWNRRSFETVDAIFAFLVETIGALEMRIRSDASDAKVAQLHASMVFMLNAFAETQPPTTPSLPCDFWQYTVCNGTGTVPAVSMAAILKLKIPVVTKALVNLAVARGCTDKLLEHVCVRPCDLNTGVMESAIVRPIFDALLLHAVASTTTTAANAEDTKDADLSVWWAPTQNTDTIVRAVCAADRHYRQRNDYLVAVSTALRLGCPFGPEAGWYTHTSDALQDRQLAELNDWIRQVGGAAGQEEDEAEEEEEEEREEPSST